jgi:hypothetical protein
MDLFAELVTVVNRVAGIEFPVTVYLSGGLISGLLIGRHAWMTRYAEWWEKDLEVDPVGAVLRESIEGFKKLDAKAGGSGAPPIYAHFREARVLAGAHLVPRNGMLFRCRLDSVIGFAPNRFVPSEGVMPVIGVGSLVPNR